MTVTGTRHGSAVVTLPSDREIGITRVFDAPRSSCSTPGRPPTSCASGGAGSPPPWSCATSTSASAGDGAT